MREKSHVPGITLFIHTAIRRIEEGSIRGVCLEQVIDYAGGFPWTKEVLRILLTVDATFCGLLTGHLAIFIQTDRCTHAGAHGCWRRSVFASAIPLCCIWLASFCTKQPLNVHLCAPCAAALHPFLESRIRSLPVSSPPTPDCEPMPLNALPQKVEPSRRFVGACLIGKPRVGTLAYFCLPISVDPICPQPSWVSALPSTESLSPWRDLLWCIVLYYRTSSGP